MSRSSGKDGRAFAGSGRPSSVEHDGPWGPAAVPVFHPPYHPGAKRTAALGRRQGSRLGCGARVTARRGSGHPPISGCAGRDRVRFRGAFVRDEINTCAYKFLVPG